MEVVCTDLMACGECFVPDDGAGQTLVPFGSFVPIEVSSACDSRATEGEQGEEWLTGGGGREGIARSVGESPRKISGGANIVVEMPEEALCIRTSTSPCQVHSGRQSEGRHDSLFVAIFFWWFASVGQMYLSQSRPIEEQRKTSELFSERFQSVGNMPSRNGFRALYRVFSSLQKNTVSN